MGPFDGRSNSYHGAGGKTSHYSRGVSPSRSARGSKVKSSSYSTRPTYGRSSSGSFFGNGLGSSRGIFGSSGGSSSYYKRRPRDGYINYLVHKLQRMIKELWQYARRNPVKAFFAIVVPLLSAGGAIHGLLRQFGVRVPGMEGGPNRMSGGYYGSSGYGGRGGRESEGWMENAGPLMEIAKAFM